MLSVHHSRKQSRIKGGVSITTLVIGLIVVGVAIVALKFFFEGAKESTEAVKDRNQNYIDQKKVLINSQNERLKTAREAQETP
jgi:beta-lactamase regulating signal transducer with metallopeptidase domain